VEIYQKGAKIQAKKAKNDFEIQAKDFEIQAKKDAKIQVTKDSKQNLLYAWCHNSYSFLGNYSRAETINY